MNSLFNYLKNIKNMLYFPPLDVVYMCSRVFKGVEGRGEREAQKW